MFIAFEGIDGSGKTTLIEFFRQALQAELSGKINAKQVLKTREPGGSELSEQIRALIMHYDMHIQTEILLMYAARVDHFEKTILPQLQAGNIVLTDRFFYSSFAYQGAGRGGDIDLLNRLQAQLLKTFGTIYQPDLLVLFDLDIHLAQSRRQKRKLQQQNIVDRFEEFDLSFQQRVQGSYQAQASLMSTFELKKETLKFTIPSGVKTQVLYIDATQPIKDIEYELNYLAKLIVLEN